MTIRFPFDGLSSIVLKVEKSQLILTHWIRLWVDHEPSVTLPKSVCLAFFVQIYSQHAFQTCFFHEAICFRSTALEERPLITLPLNDYP